MSESFFRRDWSGFFSYSHKNSSLAKSIVSWMNDCAGLRVFLDAHDLPAGRPVQTTLDRAIRKSRAFFLLLSPQAVASNWIYQEWEAAKEQTAAESLFRIVILVTHDLPDDEIPEDLQSVTRIRLGEAGLDGAGAALLLSSLYEESTSNETSRDVFVTRSWRAGPGETEFADRACSAFTKRGFRLIGDAPRPDQDPDRIRAIMRSCGAYLAFIPPRQPDELKYLLPEVKLAQETGVPAVLIADEMVLAHPPESLRTVGGDVVDLSGAIGIKMKDGLDASEKAILQRGLEKLDDEYRAPSSRYEVVFSLDAQSTEATRRDEIRRIVQGITGKGCLFSYEVAGHGVSNRLTAALKDAVAVIADVSDSRSSEAWVQAAVARGAGRPVELLTRSTKKKVPLIFNDDAPERYRTDVQCLGLIHRFVFDHRRRIMNREASRWRS